MRIREGDPLEIYTDKDGGVIFRKYSLMEGLSDFAGMLCDSLNRSTGRLTVITDRDCCIALSGIPRRELLEKNVSTDLEQLMEERKIYQYKSGMSMLPLLGDGENRYYLDTVAPILSEGDVLGCVLFASEAGQLGSGEVEYKLAQSIAAFLGKHMEF